MNKYEVIVIIKPDLADDLLQEQCAKVEETIKKHEGKVEKSEKWGKKRLGFRMKKFNEGFFLFVNFEAEPSAIKTLVDIFKIDNNILRAQISRTGS